MAKNIVTLYIDDTSLRLMVTRGKRIKKLAELPLQLNSASINVDIEEAEVAAKVKQLFKSQKVRKKKVIVGLSGLHCLTRPITLPQLPRAMLAEAVIREARRVLPVPPEQLYISWQTIPAQEGKARVFLVAIPCKMADTLLRVLRQAGLKSHLMDLKPLALARLVKEATAVIVDVQSTEFDIVIMADGVPQPVRTVPFPSETLSQQDKLLMVRNELDRTIKFYNSSNPENPLVSEVPIFVSGELADKPKSGKFLSEELGHPVLPLSSPLKCPQRLDPTRYLVNIGLALKELDGEAGPSVASVNALPVPYRPKPIPVAKILAVPGVAAVIGLLVLLATFVQDASASIAFMRSQMETTSHILEQKHSQKKELMGNIAELEGKLAAAEASREAFITALDSLVKQGDTINSDLEVTTNSLLSTINLSSISHDGGQLTINGSSPSETEVLAYARNLDASGRFSKVTIASLRRGEVAGESEVEGEGEVEGGGEVAGEGEVEGEVEGGGEGEVESVMNFTIVLETGGQG